MGERREEDIEAEVDGDWECPVCGDLYQNLHDLEEHQAAYIHWG